MTYLLIFGGSTPNFATLNFFHRISSLVTFDGYVLEIERVSTQCLTNEQQEAVIKDFAVWSGGFTPAEMADEDHKVYARARADVSLDEDAVYRFLSGRECP